MKDEASAARAHPDTPRILIGKAYMLLKEACRKEARQEMADALLKETAGFPETPAPPAEPNEAKKRKRSRPRRTQRELDAFSLAILACVTRENGLTPRNLAKALRVSAKHLEPGVERLIRRGQMIKHGNLYVAAPPKEESGNAQEVIDNWEQQDKECAEWVLGLLAECEGKMAWSETVKKSEGTKFSLATIRRVEGLRFWAEGSVEWMGI